MRFTRKVGQCASVPKVWIVFSMSLKVENSLEKVLIGIRRNCHNGHFSSLVVIWQASTEEDQDAMVRSIWKIALGQAFLISWRNYSS